MSPTRQPDLAAERAAREELMGLSNWGRWGPDDQAGAANLVDAAATARGLASVRRHRTYSLGALIDGVRSPRLSSLPWPQHHMLRDGGDWMALRDDPDNPENRGVWSDRQTAADAITLTPHGTTSHVDGLAHCWAEHVLYNGIAEHEVRSDGARKLGIEQLPAIATRGLLFDVAALHGVTRLDADTIITDADLVECAERIGVEVQSGDAVLVHTGWPSRYREDPAAYGGAQPGIGASAGLYLARREVCLVGADNTAVQPWPGQGEIAVTDPRVTVCDIHIPFLRNLGIYLIEMLDLSGLAADGVGEFLFVLAPLRIRGGTGSPVNPVAVA